VKVYSPLTEAVNFPVMPLYAEPMLNTTFGDISMLPVVVIPLAWKAMFAETNNNNESVSRNNKMVQRNLGRSAESFDLVIQPSITITSVSNGTKLLRKRINLKSSFIIQCNV